jgi:hypothetical protein
VVASDGALSTPKAVALSITNANDAPTGKPSISGTTTQGQVLAVVTSAIQDVDGIGTLRYQWMADGVNIDRATSSALTLAQAHVGKGISVKVSYTDGLGTEESVVSGNTKAVLNINDAPTGTIAIEGAGVVGMQLKAVSTLVDPDGLGALTYQWFSAGTAITGAKAATFTPTVTEAGKAITVNVSYTDGFQFAESKTSSAITVAKEDDTPALTNAIDKVSAQGDGNGDGKQDSAQNDVVSAKVTKLDNTSTQVFVTLVADSKNGAIDTDTNTAQLTNVQQQAKPADLPATLDLPIGLLDFSAKVSTVGQAETFSLYVDSSLNVNGYWKQDASGTWVNLASAPYGGKVVIEGNKTRVDFTITDGGEFDNDGQADGIITDPGAVGAMPLSLVGYAPDVVLTAGGHFFF